MRKDVIKPPTLRGIDNSAADGRLGVGFHRLRVKFKPSQCLNTCNHPNKRLVGESAVCISAADVLMGARKPCLLHVPLWLLSPRYGPKCRNEGTPVLINADCV